MVTNTKNQKSILIIEDMPAMLEVLGDKFSREGFVVFKATNGSEGLSLAKTKIPDVILSDILMPVMDGLQMAQGLLRSEETKHIPIILLSVLAENELPKGVKECNNVKKCLWKNELSMAQITRRVMQVLVGLAIWLPFLRISFLGTTILEFYNSI